ncbi:MAG: BNR-4 repeat-containing protein [Candidatus Nealsonbacteria bacterium]|nr:BNR-4 repeat-containing protein [Candidatus Nealsonbacteria bacterium]
MLRSILFVLCLPLLLPGVAHAADAVLFSDQDPLPTADGYRGIWYSNQPQGDEYVYKYSGGLGTYCAKHRPFAVYAKEADKTFFCYGGTDKDGSTLLHIVSYYDHATGTASPAAKDAVPRPRILLDKRTTDAHDNPVISIDSQGHIWIFSSSHGTTRPSYIHRSKRPYDIDGFELVCKTNFSYPQPHWVPGHGFLLLHTKYGGGRRLFQTTSTDGRTWSEPQMIAHVELGHYQISAQHGGKIGTAFNFHPKPNGLNWRTNLYYLQTDDLGKTWHNAEGQAVKLPLTAPDNGAMVHDYRPEKRNVYLKDMTFDADGRPVILYLTSGGWESGPKNDPRTWQTARWTGSQWEIRGSITSDNNYDAGSLYIEPDGIWRLIAPTEPGPQPYNTGGEVVLWISRDRGTTWKKSKQLTHGSPYNHTYVRRPVNAHPDFYAFWADGHARKPSPSRLYFTNRAADRVQQLPTEMPPQP